MDAYLNSFFICPILGCIYLVDAVKKFSLNSQHMELIEPVQNKLLSHKNGEVVR